jgi:hypothetical protein
VIWRPSSRHQPLTVGSLGSSGIDIVLISLPDSASCPVAGPLGAGAACFASAGTWTPVPVVMFAAAAVVKEPAAAMLRNREVIDFFIRMLLVFELRIHGSVCGNDVPLLAMN